MGATVAWEDLSDEDLITAVLADENATALEVALAERLLDQRDAMDAYVLECLGIDTRAATGSGGE